MMEKEQNLSPKDYISKIAISLGNLCECLSETNNHLVDERTGYRSYLFINIKIFFGLVTTKAQKVPI